MTEQQISLDTYFRQNFFEPQTKNYTPPQPMASPFTDWFLHGSNLLKIQDLLTKTLRDRVDNQNLPLVEFSDSIVASLMTFAVQYRAAEPNANMINYANYSFASQFLEQNEGNYYQKAFWDRWCKQGIPDPNNIPLPISRENTDYSAEIDTYTLTSPNMYSSFPRF